MRKFKITRLNHKTAFTLAEVLITLVIIGIVASITIPSVIVSYQKHETITRLKKIYSTLSQTTNKAIADHGPIKNWDFDVNDTKAFVDKYVAPYLNVVKNCGYDNTGECESKVAYLKRPENLLTVPTTFYKIILSDGASLYFRARQNENTINGAKIKRSFFILIIDINGKRMPNVYGKDVFQYVYWISNDLTPAGDKDRSGTFKPDGGFNEPRENYKTWSCNKTGTGEHCAGLIMVDGWQIKDDYPW